jgi:23S rRNA (uracil1939-C5)-methyltransferase
MDSSSIRKGAELELTVDSLAYGGRGVARVANFVVFIDGAVPGETVKARIYRKRKGYAEARAVAILASSPQTVTPACDHFQWCGGCRHQQLDYLQQVEQKRQQVEDIYRRLADLPTATVTRVIPAEQIYRYRNKMEFSFSNRRWVLPEEPEGAQRDFALGLHIPGRYDRILDIHACHLQPERGNNILNVVREVAREHRLKPYDVKTHIGFLRHLVLRYGFRTGQIMVNLVTAYENPDLLAPIVSTLVDRFPEVVSVINNINTRAADIAYGEWEILLHGRSTIEEQIGDLTFEISANSFFQTNTLQAENLYRAVRDGAGLTGQEVVYDLYCGTGSISLFLAAEAREVHGLELIDTAIEDATRNAVNNGITNCRFYQANLDTFFSRDPRRKGLPPPDVIVVDPPRAGMHDRLARRLPALGARRIVYVSCNPTTQARDVHFLLRKGYRLNNLTLVDMFPHTPHIETVAVFVRETAGSTSAG